MASIWVDPEKSDELKKLYGEGLTCTQIAETMGCGLTRNAVIGRVHRLGLKLRGPTAGMRRSEKVKNPPLAKRTRLVRSNANSTALRLIQVNEPTGGALRCVEIEPRGLTLLELEHGDCHYPYGEGSGITFCGHPILAPFSYCAPHRALTQHRPHNISEADHERRHFMGLLKRSNSPRSMGVPS